MEPSCVPAIVASGASHGGGERRSSELAPRTGSQASSGRQSSSTRGERSVVRGDDHAVAVDGWGEQGRGGDLVGGEGIAPGLVARRGEDPQPSLVVTDEHPSIGDRGRDSSLRSRTAHPARTGPPLGLASPRAREGERHQLTAGHREREALADRDGRGRAVGATGPHGLAVISADRGIGSHSAARRRRCNDHEALAEGRRPGRRPPRHVGAPRRRTSQVLARAPRREGVERVGRDVDEVEVRCRLRDRAVAGDADPLRGAALAVAGRRERVELALRGPDEDALVADRRDRERSVRHHAAPARGAVAGGDGARDGEYRELVARHEETPVVDREAGHGRVDRRAPLDRWTPGGGRRPRVPVGRAQHPDRAADHDQAERHREQRDTDPHRGPPMSLVGGSQVAEHGAHRGAAGGQVSRRLPRPSRTSCVAAAASSAAPAPRSEPATTSESQWWSTTVREVAISTIQTAASAKPAAPGAPRAGGDEHQADRDLGGRLRVRARERGERVLRVHRGRAFPARARV